MLPRCWHAPVPTLQDGCLLIQPCSIVLWYITCSVTNLKSSLNQKAYGGFNLPVHRCDCRCKCNKFRGAVRDEVIFVSHSFRSKCNNFSEFAFVFFRGLVHFINLFSFFTRVWVFSSLCHFSPLRQRLFVRFLIFISAFFSFVSFVFCTFLWCCFSGHGSSSVSNTLCQQV